MEDKELKVLSSAIVKGILIICMGVVLIMWGFSCDLDAKTIQECKSACSATGSQMKSVSRRECACEKKSSDNWVIPRD